MEQFFLFDFRKTRERVDYILLHLKGFSNNNTLTVKKK